MEASARWRYIMILIFTIFVSVEVSEIRCSRSHIPEPDVYPFSHFFEGKGEFGPISIGSSKFPSISDSILAESTTSPNECILLLNGKIRISSSCKWQWFRAKCCLCVELCVSFALLWVPGPGNPSSATRNCLPISSRALRFFLYFKIATDFSIVMFVKSRELWLIGSVLSEPPFFFCFVCFV